MDSSLFSHSDTSGSTNEENEYVWDGYTQQGSDDVIPIPTTGNDYYEDLELAARLGKTLLEKNKELETINYQLKYCNEEQTMEIGHLTKQMLMKREIDDAKSRFYEQMDVTNSELESENKSLKKEVTELKEKLIKCCTHCENQEDQIISLRSEVEALKLANDCKKKREIVRRRTIHSCLPSTEVTALLEFLENSSSDDFSMSLQESLTQNQTPGKEMKDLQETISNLKVQQTMDRRRMSEIKSEVEFLVNENHEFIERLREEKEISQRLSEIVEEYERDGINQQYSGHNLSEEIENSEIDFSSEYPEDVFQNETGISSGSTNFNPVQHNQPPLEQYLKITNSTPVKDSASSDSSAINMDIHNLHPDYNIDNHEERDQQSREWVNFSDNLKKECKNVSLVQELDTQYKTLLEKYEKLLESIEYENDDTKPLYVKDQSSTCSKNRDSILGSRQETKPRISTVVSNNGDLVRSMELKEQPAYKQLFKEIFTILNQVKLPNKN